MTSSIAGTADDPADCGSLEPGQEVKVKIHISGDGTMVAEGVEIQ